MRFHRSRFGQEPPDQRDAIALAPQPDEPGRMHRQFHHLEAGNGLALLHGAVDVHGTTIPDETLEEAVEQADVGRELVHLPTVAAAGALGLGNCVWMTHHVGVGAQSRSGAPVIGVAALRGGARDPAPAGPRADERRASRGLGAHRAHSIT